MIIMKRDGALQSEVSEALTSDNRKGLIELPSSVVLRDSSIIDLLLTLALDVLRLQSIKLRIYEDENREL
jgi:hypothetical protein